MHLLNRRDLFTTAFSLASVLTSGPVDNNNQAASVETKSQLISLTNNAISSKDNDSVLDTIVWDAPKKVGLNSERMSDAINDGLREREWFVTGQGLPELFADDFSFSDPQVSVTGIEDYCRSVRRLFDQTTARCEVICCSVTAANTITVLWRNSGKVNLGPGGGVELKPYVVTTTLRTDQNNGLIVSQKDTFDSDVLGLLLYQVPALRSSLAGPAAAPIDVLRQRCNFETCQLTT
mmetsp:Transcript_229/g.341  ORF Transcript_229/g.341 Transcript_229/m.341 type:complete len:235 (+) Transcript_229:80-784(+)